MDQSTRTTSTDACFGFSSRCYDICGPIKTCNVWFSGRKGNASGCLLFPTEVAVAKAHRYQYCAVTCLKGLERLTITNLITLFLISFAPPIRYARSNFCDFNRTRIPTRYEYARASGAETTHLRVAPILLATSDQTEETRDPCR